MNIFNRKLRRKSKQNTRPMPSWETVVEIMFDKHLDAFADEVAKVIYSRDRSIRYVILKNEKELFTYQLEAIYQYDENEWKYIYSDDNALPALWEPVRGVLGKSFFESIEELLKKIESEPEYKQYFD